MKKQKNKIIPFLLLLIIFSYFFPLVADAAGIVPCGRKDAGASLDEQQPCTLCHLVIGIQRIVTYGRNIVTFVALVMIVIGGIWYIVSTGNEQMMGTAKNILKTALTGFAIVFLVWLAVNYTMYLISVNNFGWIKSGATWNQFTCDTAGGGGETADPPPTTPPPPTFIGCCFVALGKCSHVSSVGDCTTGTFYNKACADVPLCTVQLCGNKNMGFCSYSGSLLTLICPTGYSFLSGGTDCPTSAKCCVKNSQVEESCGINASGTCKPNGVSCTQPGQNSLHPDCASGLKCCKN